MDYEESSISIFILNIDYKESSIGIFILKVWFKESSYCVLLFNVLCVFFFRSSYPNVEFGGEWLAHVEIHHFRRPVGQGRVLPDLLLHRVDALLFGVQHLGRGRPKIAQDIVSS